MTVTKVIIPKHLFGNGELCFEVYEDTVRSRMMYFTTTDPAG